MPPSSIAVPTKKARRGGALRPGESGRDSLAAEIRRTEVPVVARSGHRFQVGQRLSLANGGRVLSRAEGICTVVAALPFEGHGSLLYRVRSDAEQYERVVPEIDLSPPENIHA